MSSLQKCHRKRTKYLDELTDLSKRLDTTWCDQIQGEIEARMSVVCTTISKLEDTIDQYENLLEECQLRDNEAQHGDQDRPDSQEEDDVRVESSREEEESDSPNPDSPDCSNIPETQPHLEADVESTQAGTSEGNLAVTPKEERILMQDQPMQTGLSPASDTTSVMGDLARLQVHTPPHQGPEDGDTSK